MARMEQIQQLWEILKSKNWISVYNEQSGIYYKKGYLLVYGDKHDVTPSNTSMQNVFSRFLHENLLGASDWYIERDGFVIARGNITQRLLDAQRWGEQDARYKDWLKQINDIEAVSTYSETQEIQKRLSLQYVETQGNVCRYMKHEGPIRDTLAFAFTQNAGQFQVGQIYKIMNIALGVVYLRQVIDGEMVLGTITMIATDFVAYEKTGVIVSMEPIMGVGMVKRLALMPVNSEAVGSIPKEALQFKIKDKSMLRKAVAKCVNITPLLMPGITMTDELLDVLVTSIADLSPVLSADIDEDSSIVLAQLLRSKVCLSSFVYGDANFLQLQMHDFEQEFEGFARTANISSNNLDLARELYSYGVTKIDDSLFKQYVRFKGNRSGLVKATDTLLRDGLFTENNVFIRWNTLPDKTELFTYFSAAGLTVENKSWSEWLTKIVETTNYFTFDATHGFTLQIGNARLGRDYNGLVFYDVLFNPIWRAVKINETFIQYGEFPTNYFAI